MSLSCRTAPRFAPLLFALLFASGCVLTSFPHGVVPSGAAAAKPPEVALTPPAGSAAVLLGTLAGTGGPFSGLTKCVDSLKAKGQQLGADLLVLEQSDETFFLWCSCTAQAYRARPKTP